MANHTFLRTKWVFGVSGNMLNVPELDVPLWWVVVVFCIVLNPFGSSKLAASQPVPERRLSGFKFVLWWLLFFQVTHKCSSLQVPPTPNTHLFSGYHVDPLLKKPVCTMENQVLQKIPLKSGSLE